MAVLKSSCDNCDKVIEGRIYEDFDGIHRCQKCHIKSRLRYEESTYKKDMGWLKATHIKKLKEKRKEIMELRSKLNALETVVNDG